MQAIHYIVLSGLGWVFDLTLFSTLVSNGVAPGVANLFSATIAAMAVYAVSRRIIFRSTKFQPGRFAAYFAYTEANIGFWAVAVQLLTGLILGSGLPIRGAQAAIVAKILITPLSMVSNFMVTRWLSLWKRHG